MTSRLRRGDPGTSGHLSSPHTSNFKNIFVQFWNTIYFYTASATAGNLSYDFARGRHFTVSAAASRRHVDASLDLFTRKSPDQIHAYGTHDLGGNPSVSIRVPIWVLRRWKVLTSHHRNKYMARKGKPWGQPTKARDNPSRLRPKKTREVALEREI